MKRILILEDNSSRIQQFRRNLAPHVIHDTDNAGVAIKMLNEEQWDVLFLDHDLGGMVGVDVGVYNSGSEVARWLHDHPNKKPRTIIIHSMNPVGQTHMKLLVPESVIYPSAWVYINYTNLTEDSISLLEDTARSQTKRMLI